MVEWNKRNSNIWNSETLDIFYSNVLKFKRSNASSSFSCHNPVGVKLFYTLRLRLSHVHEQNFEQIFQEIFNPLCIGGKEVETTSHFLFSCPNHSAERWTLLNKIRNIHLNVLENTYSRITQFLQYGHKYFTAPLI